MDFKNILITALFTTTALHGALRTWPVPSKTVLASAAAGAAAFAVGNYSYKTISALWVQANQDNAAQACALKQGVIKDDTEYNITVNLSNTKNPITITEKPKVTTKNTLMQLIPDDINIKSTGSTITKSDAAIAADSATTKKQLTTTQPQASNLTKRAALATNIIAKKALMASIKGIQKTWALSKQGLSSSLQGLQVTTSTLIKNRMTWIGLASIALNSYLFKNKTIPTSIKSLILGTNILFVGNYFKEKFKKEFDQKVRNSIISEAIQTIMNDARTRKKSDALTYTYTFSIKNNQYSITRQQQAVFGHDSLPAVSIFNQQYHRRGEAPFNLNGAHANLPEMTINPYFNPYAENIHQRMPTNNEKK